MDLDLFVRSYVGCPEQIREQVDMVLANRQQHLVSQVSIPDIVNTFSLHGPRVPDRMPEYPSP